METLNILWKIVPKSQGTIGILRVTVEGVRGTVVLRCSDQSEVIVQGIRSSVMSNVISAMQAMRFSRKECEAAFFALILDSKRG